MSHFAGTDKDDSNDVSSSTQTETDPPKPKSSIAYILAQIRKYSISFLLLRFCNLKMHSRMGRRESNAPRRNSVMNPLQIVPLVIEVSLQNFSNQSPLSV